MFHKQSVGTILLVIRMIVFSNKFIKIKFLINYKIFILLKDLAKLSGKRLNLLYYFEIYFNVCFESDFKSY